MRGIGITLSGIKKRQSIGRSKSAGRHTIGRQSATAVWLRRGGWDFDEADLHGQVVERPEEEQTIDEEEEGVESIEPASLRQVGTSPEHGSQTDGQDDEEEERKDDASCPRELRSN